MKHSITGLIALIAFPLLFAQSAFADTYIVLMNTLDEPVSVNGSAKVSGEGGGIWSPLDATIIYSGNKTARIKDMHKKCSDGGWLIQGTTPDKTTNLCLQLGFAEVGCVLTILSKKDSKYTIEMEKARGTVCSDQWWNSKGKSMFTEAYDLYTRQTKLGQDGAKAAAELISAIK